MIRRRHQLPGNRHSFITIPPYTIQKHQIYSGSTLRRKHLHNKSWWYAAIQDFNAFYRLLECQICIRINSSNAARMFPLSAYGNTHHWDSLSQTWRKLVFWITACGLLSSRFDWISESHTHTHNHIKCSTHLLKSNVTSHYWMSVNGK